MCTLSWQHHLGRLDIMFSRDELRSRPPAMAPAISAVDGIEYLAPTDPKGGGTWMFSNGHGLAVCLLNSYGDKASSRQGTWRSRGSLVKGMASLCDIPHVRNQLHKTALTRYQPFILVVFSGTEAMAQWQWNGQYLDEIERPVSPVCTSSLYPKFIPWLRRRRFHSATRHAGNSLPVEMQMALHRSRRPWSPAFAVAMSRRNKATVSLTHICITSDVIDMHYWPGDPAGEMRQAASQSLQLVQPGSVQADSVQPDSVRPESIQRERKPAGRASMES